MTELERDVVIVACAISAGMHVALAPMHFAHGTTAGVGFLGAAAVLAVLAALLTLRPAGPAIPAVAAAVLAILVASYPLAVSSGLPVLHPTPEPVDGLALVTKAIEATGLLAAGQLLRGGARSAPRPIPLPLTTLIALFSALAALAVSGGHGHA